MIECILPSTVAVASRLDDRHPASLFPEEEAVIGGAVPKRRAEFATGRACAREALETIGFPPSPILQGDRGEPAWPVGVTGSITHCIGYRASAVARDEDLCALGIDAEPNEPLPPGLLSDIALPEEREALKDHLAQDPGISWDRLLFCAKEAIYKAWFPLMETWLGFDDAIVRFDTPNGAFTGELLVPGPTIGGHQLETVAGRWSARDGILLTAIAIPPPDSSAARARS